MRRSLFTAGLLIGGVLMFFSSVSFAAAAALTEAQIQAIISLVNSFGVSSDVTARIEHALRDIPDIATSTPPVYVHTNSAWRHAVCMRLAEDEHITAAIGTRGDFVNDLQKFLADQGFLVSTSTGFFGSLTARALGKWQIQNGLMLAEDEHLGWGIFGPRTRDLLKKWCNGEWPPIIPGPGNGGCPIVYDPVCGQPPEPACRHSTPACMIATPGPHTYPNSCFLQAAGGTLLYQGQCKDQDIGTGTTTVPTYTPDASCRAWYDGCNDCKRAAPDGAVTCTTRQCVWQAPGYCTQKFETVNKPPVISGFSGPTALAINEVGTWTVNASDPENGTLSYFILWGDERTALNTANVSATAAFTQTTSFTHSFSTAGTYKIVVLVRDAQGAMAQATATVQVGGGTTIACTQDAKLCPDGSYVGRTGSNCEFSACPATSTSNYNPRNDATCALWGEGQCTSCRRTSPGATPQCVIAMCVVDSLALARIAPTCTFHFGPDGKICFPDVNGQCLNTNPTDGSCVAYGKIFPNEYVERNAFCNVHWQQACLSEAVMFIPWTCTNGQWVLTTTGASCTTPAGTTYSNGTTIPFTGGEFCTINHPCAVGLIFPKTETCSNGQWVPQISL